MSTEAIELLNADDGVSCRTIDDVAAESIRQWKNTHRERFFHTQVISVEQQRTWFHEYSNRSEDFMFLIHHNSEVAGCCGIRLIDTGWDVYNLIRAPGSLAPAGVIRVGAEMIIDFAYSRRPERISVKMLATNVRAIRFMQRSRCFVHLVSTDQDYVLIDLAPTAAAEAVPND